MKLGKENFWLPNYNELNQTEFWSYRYDAKETTLTTSIGKYEATFLQPFFQAPLGHSHSDSTGLFLGKKNCQHENGPFLSLSQTKDFVFQRRLVFLYSVFRGHTKI